MSQLHFYTLSFTSPEQWPIPQGIREEKGKDKLYRDWWSVSSGFPVFSPACPSTHPLLFFTLVPPHAEQSKKIKSSQRRAKQNHRWCVEPGGHKKAFLHPSWWSTMLLNFFTQLPEFMWKGSWSSSSFPGIPISLEKFKVLWSNKMSIFPQTVLKYAYKQHRRKEEKTGMHK